VDFKITWQKDVFSDTPQTGSAASFGTLGITLRARKPGHPAEWHAALNAFNCAVSTSS
jgi:hypothetical protein